MNKFQEVASNHSENKSFPRNWDEVKATVAEVEAQWDQRHRDTRTGRAKDYLRKMGNAMNNHSSALKMLPSEDNYMSVISGSVSMIIKASDVPYSNDDLKGALPETGNLTVAMLRLRQIISTSPKRLHVAWSLSTKLSTSPRCAKEFIADHRRRI